MSKTAVLIPCLNEAMTIEKVISDIYQIAPDFDVYVCDNGSTDNTSKIAKNAGATVIYEQKQGKGNALNTLFQHVIADCYILCDGDGETDISQIQNMADTILKDNYDIATGNRFANKNYSKNIKISHRLYNYFINFLTKFLYKPGIDDVLSGYRAMSDNFVKSLPKLQGGFTCELEISIYALKHNLKTINVPVSIHTRIYGQSKTTIKNGLQILFEIIRTKFQKHDIINKI